MALRYYPLTRIIPNLYTRGNEFVLPDGKAYTGKYYRLYDGTSYVGANPVVGTNEQLTPISEIRTITSTPVNNTSYTVAKTQGRSNILPDSDIVLTQLTPYYPVVLESDYQQGYFLRYFAKNVTGPQFIIEISQADYSQLQNGTVSPNMLGYVSTSMLWQLTGPLKDTRVSQYQIIGGVYDTNKRVTEAKQKGFNGIIEFIGGDYTKFARITP
jgi:hypothetical protein